MEAPAAENVVDAVAMKGMFCSAKVQEKFLYW